MSSDIIVHAKPSNKYAKTLCLAFLLSAAVVYAVSLFLPSYVGVVQLVSVAFLTVGLVFYTRYLAPKYAYEITTDTEDTPILVVRQTTGKRISSLCAIELADVSAITRLDRTAIKETKLPEGYKKYIYTPTFLPEVLTLIEVRSRYEKSHIYIEVTEEFTDYLSSRVEEAKALRSFDEEY